jgi:hypothetical protein
MGLRAAGTDEILNVAEVERIMIVSSEDCTHQMFGRKKVFDDNEKSKFVEAIADMLAIQMTVATGRSIESAEGRINRKAIGYIYGFIDCALRSIGQDMSDVSVGVPITYQILQHLFPRHEQAYTSFLIDHLNDEVVVLGMMAGGQQYADFNKPDAKGSPMGLARLILEGDK